MEMYKKPVMEIVELEKVDVLTCSGCDYDGIHSAGGEVTSGNYPDGCYEGCTKHSS